MEGVPSLVSLGLFSNLNSSNTIFHRGGLLKKASVWHCESEQIVPVKSLPSVVDFVPGVFADSCVCGRLQVIEVVDASIIFVGVEKGLLN